MNPDDTLPFLQDKPLIVVDGRMGIGKSTFARAVNKPLRALVIETDWFVENLWGRDTRELTYPDILDLEALEVRVRDALERGPVVLEGICVLDIVRRLGREPAAHVLVSALDPATASFDLGSQESMDASGDYVGVHDAALLDASVSHDDLMAALREEWPHDMMMDRSLVGYFKQFKPHHSADVIYLR